MAEEFDIVRPYFLANPRRQAPPFDMLDKGVYDTTLSRTDDEAYTEGDLVFLDDGKLHKCTETGAGDVGGLMVAGQNWFDPEAERFRNPKTDNNPWRNLGVAVNYIDPDDEWVITLPGELTEAINNVLLAKPSLDVVFNAAAGVLVLANATASPAFKVDKIFRGQEGDTNVWVQGRWLRGKIAGSN